MIGDLSVDGEHRRALRLVRPEAQVQVADGVRLRSEPIEDQIEVVVVADELAGADRRLEADDLRSAVQFVRNASVHTIPQHEVSDRKRRIETQRVAAADDVVTENRGYVGINQI